MSIIYWVVGVWEAIFKGPSKTRLPEIRYFKKNYEGRLQELELAFKDLSKKEKALFMSALKQKDKHLEAMERGMVNARKRFSRATTVYDSYVQKAQTIYNDLNNQKRMIEGRVDKILRDVADLAKDIKNVESIHQDLYKIERDLAKDSRVYAH